MTDVMDPPVVEPEMADDSNGTRGTRDYLLTVVRAAPPDPPSEPDASTALSDEEREFLARRPAVMEALRNVKLAKTELASAEMVLEQAKSSVKGKEAALEAAWDSLESAESDDNMERMPLFTTPAMASAVSQATGDASQWEAKWESFLDTPVAKLDVSEGIKEKLAEHSPEPIRTLRDLAKLKETNPVQGYGAIKGIGPGKADKLDDAFVALQAEFLRENPNPTPPASQESKPAQTPAAIDFVDTFPEPINPTPNESYAPDYHRDVIKTAMAERDEIYALKEQLTNGTTAQGKPLTDKQRKKIETSLGETQMQYDDTFDLYAEKFGQSQADALKRHIETTVEKKTNLKGGLD